MLRRKFNKILSCIGLSAFLPIQRLKSDLIDYNIVIVNFTFNGTIFQVIGNQKIVLKSEKIDQVGIFQEKTNLRLGTIVCHPPINYAGNSFYIDPVLFVPSSKCNKTLVEVALPKMLWHGDIQDIDHISYITEKPTKISISELNLEFSITAKETNDLSISRT